LSVTGNGKRRKLPPWIDNVDGVAYYCLLWGAWLLGIGLVSFPFERYPDFNIGITILGAVILTIGIVLAVVLNRATK
jgi:hypothetical protein